MAHGVSMIQDRMELMRRMRAYAIRVATLQAIRPELLSTGDITNLFPHFPQALHTAEQVAAPQQEAAKVKIL